MGISLLSCNFTYMDNACTPSFSSNVKKTYNPHSDIYFVDGYRVLLFGRNGKLYYSITNIRTNNNRLRNITFVYILRENYSLFICAYTNIFNGKHYHDSLRFKEIKIPDWTLESYINLKPIIIPQSCGRHEHRRFWKTTRVSII